jgi:hypothetical protein
MVQLILTLFRLLQFSQLQLVAAGNRQITNAYNQLFISQYLVKLPEKKVLENFIKRELHQ